MKKYYWLLISVAVIVLFLTAYSISKTRHPGTIMESPYLLFAIYVLGIEGFFLNIITIIFLSSEKMAGEKDIIFSVLPIFSDDEDTPIIYNHLVAMAKEEECLIRTYPIKYPHSTFIMIPQRFVKKVSVTLCYKQKRLSIKSVYNISFYFFLKIEHDWQYFSYNY